MQSFLRFLKNLLIRTPLEFLVAILRTIFLAILVIVTFLLKLLECLIKIFKKRNLYQEEKKKPCGRLPEPIIRRPDPCIYSQRLLLSQNLPVTWNNPDIWVARAENPNNIEPDSYHLLDDTDYIVSVRVHNASATDPAIGVRVRLNYRPWSFNSPDLVPVEIDPSGNEVFRFVNVSPMSSAITQFNWHTPKLEPGEQSKHFCLQASLFHPMDTNTSNNMGQENTNVYSSNPGHVIPGEEVELVVPLFNLARKTQAFAFNANLFQLEDVEEKFELDLKTTRGYTRWSYSQKVANSLPNLHIKRSGKTRFATGGMAIGNFNFQTQPRVKVVKSKYIGFDRIRENILSRDYTLLPDFNLTAEGREIGEGIVFEPKESKDIRFTLKVPEHARPGDSFSVNLAAISDDDGVLAGGVTILLNVREE